ncbi:alpha-hydroxy acid oxidase [Nonomuraea sediminis]|uniref:alpha-hydroxy acid oxidase n=1 Tax=Nonomuraea sediminis TaxID=2835864 RepID=UPI001BDCB34A|nr:alpha-hydroxy acid oxidase [Nonomuraea sediminis]
MDTRMQPLTLADVETAAGARLDRAVWDFVQGGAGDTVRANTAAFARWRLRPSVGVDVSAIDLEMKLLGSHWRMPVAVAPLAPMRLCHRDGEVACAAAATAAGVPMTLGMLASYSIEAVAGPQGVLWQQLYLLRDRTVTASVARRAQAAGATALVLTMDVPWTGRRLGDMRSGFRIPDHLRSGNVGDVVPVTWRDVAWLAEQTDLPVICKGIGTGGDADKAIEAGAAAVIVSNHGGRQLDGALASLDALPEVVDAVAGRVPVLVDGGIRTGRDVLVALALGARAVLVGRPVLCGLAYAGRQGVEQVLGILADELHDAMGQCGRPALAAIDRSLITPANGAPG